MTLPASGAISLANVNVELSKTSTATIGMNCTDVRNLFGKASGTISMSDGYGKANEITGCATYTSPGSYTWTVPAQVSSVSVVAVGGGGGMSMTGGSLSYKNKIAVTTSDTHLIFVGNPGNSSRCCPQSGQGTYMLKKGINTNYNALTQSHVHAQGGNFNNQVQLVGDGGGSTTCRGGGSGASGYGCVGQFTTAKGGKGIDGSNGGSAQAGTQGAGGGGGGEYYGPFIFVDPPCCTDGVQPWNTYASGGGVGLKGRGSNGAGGSNGYAGGGGSGGQSGGNGIFGYQYIYSYYAPPGGNYGGGGVRDKNYSGGSYGGQGGLRIVYPGSKRYFPTTCVS